VTPPRIGRLPTVHTLDDSLDTVRLTPAFGDPHAPWRSQNDAGVSFALEGRWPEALEAFTAALTEAPSFVEAPDVHALLHGNRAQAHFHCGEGQLAVESARRALAARLVCGDADDAPVARMRADLGVYLAACGAHADAVSSLDEARTRLEARYGDDDLRLATVLENLARVQLLAQHADRAEPLLLRLHALLGERELDTASLTPLFAAVRQARATDAEQHAGAPSASDEPATPWRVPSAPGGYDVFPMSRADDEEAPNWDAIADATPAAHSTQDAMQAVDAIDEGLDDAFDLVDVQDYPPLRSPTAAAIRSAGLVEPGEHSTPAKALKRTHPLGFEIQYGVPQDLLHGGNAA